jgi:hypothetical protein
MQADSADRSQKRFHYGRILQRPTTQGYKDMIVGCTDVSASVQIPLQARLSARMKGQNPTLLELCLADHQAILCEVLKAQSQRLGYPHPGDRQQREQCAVRPWPQRACRRQRRRIVQDPLNLISGENEGAIRWPTAGEHPDGRDFVTWIFKLCVPRKETHDVEAGTALAGGRCERGPVEGGLRPHKRLPALGRELHEVVQMDFMDS